MSLYAPLFGKQMGISFSMKYGSGAELKLAPARLYAVQLKSMFPKFIGCLFMVNRAHNTHNENRLKSLSSLRWGLQLRRRKYIANTCMKDLSVKASISCLIPLLWRGCYVTHTQSPPSTDAETNKLLTSKYLCAMQCIHASHGLHLFINSKYICDESAFSDYFQKTLCKWLRTSYD